MNKRMGVTTYAKMAFLEERIITDRICMVCDGVDDVGVIGFFIM